MSDEILKRTVTSIHEAKDRNDKSQHPAWIAFIKYCAALDHGEIELLKIQNGLPVLAETTRKKVKFQ
jgi:hypothetical protein